jgi:Ca2+-binding EF-hand superfamily protein
LQEQAFTYFDASADGTLERTELVQALSVGSKKFNPDLSTSQKKQGKKKSSKPKGPGDMLFDILDLDNSGEITFQGT